MKKIVVLCSILALLLGACQNIFTPTVAPGPTADSAATSDALFKTAVAQTLTAQPSPTRVSDLDTATLRTDSPTPSPTEVVPATSTFTPSADGTATPAAVVPTTLPNLTTTPPTATFVAPANATPTATLALGQVTPVWTLAVRLYGTLPPAVPYSQLTLVNKARTEAYISLQVTMPNGEYSILEYPVEGSVKVQAPVGHYLYVTWVGGRKMVGEFRLHQNDDRTITLFRDRVEIK